MACGRKIKLNVKLIKKHLSKNRIQRQAIPERAKKYKGSYHKVVLNGWMNEELTQQWIQETWGESEEQRILVWDSYRCHHTDAVSDNLRKTNTVGIIIPGGCTKILQPADVSWNAPFKTLYREQYDRWIALETRPMTNAGNPRAPPKALMVQWVLAAWDTISVEVIVRSFAACGITTSNPNNIHCVKSGGIASDAYSEVLMIHPK